MLQDLNKRSLEIFRQIVEAYVDTGEPVGSRTVARRLNGRLSPATIRNVMADLEESGLLRAPHTSAGRLPTDVGLRLFVDALMEVGNLAPEEREAIEVQCASLGKRPEAVLTEATSLLSGLSAHAGVVIAPNQGSVFRHVEFVPLSRERALVVLVTDAGAVENRVIDIPPGLLPSTLVQATNFINARLAGRTLDEVRQLVQKELDEHTAELDDLTARVVEAGLATQAGQTAGEATLIVRGQANLLKDLSAVQDLERIRSLFQLLETKRDLMRLVDLTKDAEGVRIFIGAEHALFAMTDCATVVAPFRDREGRVVGAIGVIGPTRLNYGRIIPLVDYTARVVGRLVT